MLVPSNRLLFWCAATLGPAALLATFAPALLPAAALLAAAALCAASLDALRAAPALDGLTAAAPDVTRLSCRCAGKVAVTLSYPPALRGRRLRAALDLPEEAGGEAESAELLLPETADRALATWPCTPLRRGLFPLATAACETDSPWRLWHVIRRLPLSGELRIYPDLRQERRKVPALFLRRGDCGLHTQRAAGKGREFEKLREYVPGDDLGDIHWKATARRRFPVTKAFQLERTQEAYVVLDISRLSGRPADDSGAPALDQAIRTALTLVLAAERLGDRCGLLVFHRTVVRFLPADTGKRHFDACRNALYTAVTEPVSPDFHELFAFIRARLPKRALLLFLTHLDCPAQADPFLLGLRLVARQHLLAVPLLTPPSTRPAFSAAPPDTPDALCAELAGQLQWRRLKELERRLRACGVRSSTAPFGEATQALVAHYLDVKARQLL